MSVSETPSQSKAVKVKFGTFGLIGNSVAASVAAGVAMAANTGLVTPTLIAAVIGAGVGYILTNQIPADTE